MTVHDNNGNTLKDETGKQYGYDAWNRMVTVLDNQGGLMETMSYTASGMRGSAVDVDLCGGNTVSQNYYSLDWQVLQKTDTIPYCGGYTTSTSTYVWGLTYVNDLVARDKGGTRTYVQQDANHNVTGLVNTSGEVILRFIYDSYGAATVLTANWGASASPMFDIGFQGGRFDPDSGLYNFQRRDYAVSLGRWMQVDPLLYPDGMNWYEAYRSGPGTFVDPTGTTIEGKCDEIAAYLEQNGVWEFKIKDIRNNGWATFYMEQGASDYLPAEILTKMLISTRNFKVKDGTAANLDAHVGARVNIVGAAESASFRFAGGDIWNYRMNREVWDWRQNVWVTKNKDVYEAIADLWVHPGQYATGCLMGMGLVMQRGISLTMGKAAFNAIARPDALTVGAITNLVMRQDAAKDDWVPGEAGYIQNTNNPQGHGATAGENIIYLGDQRWWGLLDGTTIRSLDGYGGWMDVVRSWHGAAVLARGRTVPKIGLE